jgi:hypothetical protein
MVRWCVYLTIRVEGSDEVVGITLGIPIGSCCEHPAEEDDEYDAHWNIGAAPVVVLETLLHVLMSRVFELIWE